MVLGVVCQNILFFLVYNFFENNFIEIEINIEILKNNYGGFGRLRYKDSGWRYLEIKILRDQQNERQGDVFCDGKGERDSIEGESRKDRKRIIEIYGLKKKKKRIKNRGREDSYGESDVERGFIVRYKQQGEMGRR